MCASNSNVAIALNIGPKVYDTCPSFKLRAIEVRIRRAAIDYGIPGRRERSVRHDSQTGVASIQEALATLQLAARSQALALRRKGR